MNLGLRLAGNRTVVFRCGCFFAHGGEDTGIPGWRLCLAHLDLRPLVGEAFGEPEGECVVAARMPLQRIR
jgi:hypothetical protein